MVKLVKIRYITGKNVGFEHVMKEELARVLKGRGQIEILKDAPVAIKKKDEGEKTKE